MRKGEDRGEERKERRIKKKKKEGRIKMPEFNKNTFDIF